MKNLPKTQWEMGEPMFSVIRKAKGIGHLARLCGIQRKSVLSWTRIPEHHLDTIHRALGFHPIELRPDLFDPEKIRIKIEWGIKKAAKAQRKRRYKYKRAKPKDFERAFLVDDLPKPYTARGRRLAGLP